MNIVYGRRNMSGLNEIIQWVEENIELDPNQSSEENFKDINKIFSEDGRSDLSDILGDQKAKFLEFIELETGQTASEIELESLSDTIRQLEREISKLSPFNILGTPIR